jgi:hypothetical protein
MRYASVVKWRAGIKSYTIPKKSYIEFLSVYDSYTLAHTSTSNGRIGKIGADYESQENFIDEIRLGFSTSE